MSKNAILGFRTDPQKPYTHKTYSWYPPYTHFWHILNRKWHMSKISRNFPEIFGFNFAIMALSYFGTFRNWNSQKHEKHIFDHTVRVAIFWKTRFLQKMCKNSQNVFRFFQKSDRPERFQGVSNYGRQSYDVQKINTLIFYGKTWKSWKIMKNHEKCDFTFSHFFMNNALGIFSEFHEFHVEI